jgi:Tol biopolymer transport system component
MKRILTTVLMVVLLASSAVAMPSNAEPQRPHLWVMGADGADQHLVSTRMDWGADFDWSPDGTGFVTSDTSGLHLIDAETLAETRLTDALDLDPDWGPDGTIAFSRLNDDSSSVFTVNTASGEPPQEVIVRSDNCDRQYVRGPQWSPDGETIAFNAGGGYCSVSEWDLYRWSVSDGSIRQLSTKGSPYRAAIWSPDGASLLYVSSDLGQLYRVAADGSAEVRLAGRGTQASWSPDGSRVAYFGWPPKDLSHERIGIWVVDADGSNRRFLATGGYPNWGPSGIAFTSDSEIKLVDPDTGEIHELTTTPETREWKAMWAPLGQSIAYASDNNVSTGLGHSGRELFVTSRRHLVISGWLDAHGTNYDPHFCEAGMPVEIQRRRNGDWTFVKRDTTNLHGRFRIGVPDRAGEYRVRLPEKEVFYPDARTLCDETFSGRIIHSHGMS